MLTAPDDELRASDARLQALAISTASVIWFTAPDGTVVARNPAWEAFTGQTHEQYLGWGWLDAVHPEDRDKVRKTWTTAVDTQAIMSMSYRLRRHDGQYRDVSTQGTPVFADGKLLEWAGVCVDNTQVRRTQQALRDSEESFRFLDLLGQSTRGLQDASQVMAVTAHMLGNHLGASRCAYANVEADSNRFTIRNDWSAPGTASSAGEYSLELFGPQATAMMRRGERLVVNDVDSELGTDGGGQMFHAIGVQAIICAGLVKEGRLVAMMAVHQALPRVWSLQEINLVEEVVERCWAHIERVRDNAMLRDQDRRKDEFIATLAHELRNPLAPMKYAIAMMRRSAGSKPDRSHDIIDRQVSLMARLIDDLLDLSRINRGLIELKPERVELSTLMLQAIETARPAIEAAGHTLDLVTNADTLWLDVDPARIVQVIGNLLTNAAKYTPDGGHIRLNAKLVQGQAVLEVADNGVGIPIGEQGRLFKMFTQLSHSAGRAQGGLGIGLALVKTLVELHGGTVRVHSAGLDQGSTFTIELPLAEVISSAPPADARQMPASPVTGLRVLVVEDNKDGLETLLALLEMMDYTVAGAEDGFKALDVARSFGPDIVLLDLGLPGMDGLEVARAMRADAQMKNAYIIALTGWGTEQDRKRTAEAGFDAHLTKPVEPDVLEAYLAAYGSRVAV